MKYKVISIMTQVIKVILLTALLFAGGSSSDNMKVGELSSDVRQELMEILSGSLKQNIKPECKTRMRYNSEFLLYTRGNEDNAVILNITNPAQLDPKKKVVILIHGWLSGPTTPGLTKIKNNYLMRYDYNIIVVNWLKVAMLPYSAAYCQVPAISQYIAKALCFLKQHKNIRLDEIHIVGHSLGAHIAGWVGQYISTKCKAQLGRITGLDPSGVIFNDQPDNRKLDKSDAAFVDVIYTNGDSFGTSQKLGHANFYVNCGQRQPGCSSDQGISDNTLLSKAFCSHHRSMEYMAESILSNSYIAVSCGMCPRYCRPEIITEQYRVMGEDCPQDSRAIRNFYITTKSTSPYYQAWDTYSGVNHKLFV